MKKMMVIGMVIVMALVSGNAFAGGLAGMVAKGILGNIAGDAERVVGAGADWAQESINGGQYTTYIEGDLELDSDNKVAGVQTGENAYVSVGSVTLDHSRFNDDVKIDTWNRVGTITADNDAFVDVGGVGFKNTRVNGEVDLDIDNKVSGGIHAGKGTVVRIGDFKSF
ncbi:MAG: hypothetical protein V2I97_01015 [Desulfococcaceae bacterium]|jgi:hypothetical protein|nr:hypothetical protein [Desulfococcaceae bacterium]